mmetsp:Transcript_39234/g.44983  ORF Transcript_39234/g.44983 Transcript_39234/m.44983 type:complete len:235 (-) Transcript_39234:72-776(-)
MKVSKEVLSKDSEKFGSFLKTANLSIDNFSCWTGNEYYDKRFAEAKTHLRPASKSFVKRGENDNGLGTSESIRRNSMNSHVDVKIVQVDPSIYSQNWMEIETLNSKTFGKRKTSCDDVMQFFPYSSLIQSSGSRKVYSKHLNKMHRRHKAINDELIKIQNLKTSRKRVMSMSFRPKKANRAPLQKSVWHVHYAVKSEDVHKKFGGRSWKRSFLNTSVRSNDLSTHSVSNGDSSN